MDNFVDKSKEELNEAVQKVGGAVNEFRAFLKNYNVVGMAIGIVMGAAVTKLVTSFVKRHQPKAYRNTIFPYMKFARGSSKPI